MATFFGYPMKWVNKPMKALLLSKKPSLSLKICSLLENLPGVLKLLKLAEILYWIKDLREKRATTALTVLIQGRDLSVTEIGTAAMVKTVTMEIRLESMLSCRFSWMMVFQAEGIVKVS